MAIVYPPLHQLHASTLGQARELDVLRTLAQGLNDDYALFHSVMWSSIFRDQQQFGEIDTIVLAPNGNLVLLEVKAGPVTISHEGIFKDYKGEQKNVQAQLRMQHGAIRQRMKSAGLRAYVAQLLVAPDIETQQGSVLYPRERIVDRNDFPRLPDIVRQCVPHGPEKAEAFAASRAFLLNLFSLSLDPTARLGWLDAQVTQLSDGLATWVPRIQGKSRHFLIQATAGSGKSQLAVRLLENFGQQNCAYVCFNRPLADHLRSVLPSHRDRIATFHELAIREAREKQIHLDFSAPGASFDQASSVFCQRSIQGDAELFDTLIIDEAQDFASEWLAALCQRVKPGGCLYVMEDEDQRLYQRDGKSLNSLFPEAINISSQENFRNPRQVVSTINALQLTERLIEARCPLNGEMPGFHVWEPDDLHGGNATEKVINRLLAEGYKKEQLCLLSFHGRERSTLLRQEQIGNHGLKRFTGSFDTNGQPVWSHGQLFADTLFRFKGQAAPVIILCEVDFTVLDQSVRRRLFVGMSRAQLRLEIVLSDRAAKLLAEQLDTP